MSLLSLPSEILRIIIQFVGLNEFLKAPELLLLCKHWCHETYPIFRDLSFDDENLGYHSTISYYLKRHTEALSVRSSKNKDINEDLKSLMQILQYSKVKTFRLQVDVEIDNSLSSLWKRLKSCPSFKSISSLVSSLPLPELTNLTLDLCRFGLPFRESKHICPALAARLHRLRHVRLRLRVICPELLRIQTDSADFQLQSLIINTSLYDGSIKPINKMPTRAHCCYWNLNGENCESPVGERLTKLIHNAIDFAEAAPRPWLSVVRILYHQDSPSQSVAVDCLTRKKIPLLTSDVWGDDAKSYEGDRYNGVKPSKLAHCESLARVD